MKCITVAQPWAWAILAGLEGIDYRCYGTDYRGDLLVYASPDDGPWERGQLALYGCTAPSWEELPRGVVIGIVELWQCAACSQGEWAWGLRNPRFVQPFRIRPGKRLFEVAVPRLRILPVSRAASA